MHLFLFDFLNTVFYIALAVLHFYTIKKFIPFSVYFLLYYNCCTYFSTSISLPHTSSSQSLPLNTNTGTTQDTFLRENLDWLGKSTNWAKFTAVASIGVVHKGHVHESMNLLQPYLPQGGRSSSPYSESGALYALGLIHANKGKLMLY